MNTALNVLLDLAVFLSYVVGYNMGKLSQRKQQLVPTGLVCSCGHGHGHHDDSERQCHAEVLVTYDSYGHQQLRQCTCQRYDGPPPLHILMEDFGA